MLSTSLNNGSKYESCCFAGRSYVVEYSVSVLDRIRGLAVEGLNRIRRGGIEIGGLLLGTHEGNLVRILDYHPLACEYAFGPSFVLSHKDREALRKLLETGGQNQIFSRLEVVGWYHSHTRSEIHLSERDLEIFEQFFPNPWQIALVVRPSNLEAPRFGFFFRGPDGSIQACFSCQEFTIGSQSAEDAPQPKGMASVGADGALNQSVLRELPEATGSVDRRKPSSPPNWVWASAFLVVVVTMAATYWFVKWGYDALQMKRAPQARPKRIAKKRVLDPEAMQARIQLQAAELNWLSDRVKTPSATTLATMPEDKIARASSPSPPAKLAIRTVCPPERTVPGLIPSWAPPDVVLPIPGPLRRYDLRRCQ